MKKLLLSTVLAASTLLAVAQPNQTADTSRGPRQEMGGPQGGPGGPGGPGMGTPPKNPFFMDKVFKTFMVKGYAQGGYYYTELDPKKHQVIPPQMIPNPNPNAPAGSMIPAGPPTIIDESTSSFDMKRAYIFCQADLTPRWTFWMMYDFCGEFNEYYVEFKAFKKGQMSFRMGQQKHPFGMENPFTPTKVELIDVYSQATTHLTGTYDPLMGVQYGRDLGIVMLGDILNRHVHYELALLNGSGINCIDRNNDKDFAGRIEIQPVHDFKIVASCYTGTGNVAGDYPKIYTKKSLQSESTLQNGDNYERKRWAIGAEYRTHDMFGPNSPDYWETRPIVLRAEYLAGKDDCYKSEGYYVTGSYPLPKCKFDVVASYDYMNYNKDLNLDQTNIMAGIQYWFYKQCRLQVQYVNCNSAMLGKYNQVQVQTQVAF